MNRKWVKGRFPLRKRNHTRLSLKYQIRLSPGPFENKREWEWQKKWLDGQSSHPTCVGVCDTDHHARQWRTIRHCLCPLALSNRVGETRIQITVIQGRTKYIWKQGEIIVLSPSRKKQLVVAESVRCSFAESTPSRHRLYHIWEGLTWKEKLEKGVQGQLKTLRHERCPGTQIGINCAGGRGAMGERQPQRALACTSVEDQGAVVRTGWQSSLDPAYNLDSFIDTQSSRRSAPPSFLLFWFCVFIAQGRQCLKLLAFNWVVFRSVAKMRPLLELLATLVFGQPPVFIQFFSSTGQLCPPCIHATPRQHCLTFLEHIPRNAHSLTVLGFWSIFTYHCFTEARLPPTVGRRDVITMWLWLGEVTLLSMWLVILELGIDRVNCPFHVPTFALIPYRKPLW